MMASLAAEMPEFKANAAPGPLVENPLPHGTTIFAPPAAATEVSLAIPDGATIQPSSLVEAFDRLAFPERLREPLLTLVSAECEDDPFGGGIPAFRRFSRCSFLRVGPQRWQLSDVV